jgi:hypothetical protein
MNLPKKKKKYQQGGKQEEEKRFTISVISPNATLTKVCTVFQ